jgi:hypothetical protein
MWLKWVKWHLLGKLLKKKTKKQCDIEKLAILSQKKFPKFN